MSTRRLNMAVLLLAATLAASAAEYMFDRPLDFLDCRMRTALNSSRPTVATISWNLSDTTAYILKATLPSKIEADYALGAEASFTLSRRSASTDSIISVRRAYVTYDAGRDAGFTLTLRTDDSGSRFCAGTSKACVDFAVPFDTHSPGALSISTDGPEMLYENVIYRSIAPIRRYGDEQTDSLLSRIVCDNSTPEGVWTYLDCNIDETLAAAGGFYTLAVIANGGGYDIVYLEGDKTGRTDPLTVKGTLRPTIFKNHFDLDWTDIRGRSLPECHADMEVDGQVLTLNFPRLKSQLRFRRSAP